VPVRSRKSHRSGHLVQVDLSDSVVQASVLGLHYEPVAPRDIVDTHGKLHYSPIQCQEAVQELAGIALAGDLIAFHLNSIDSKSNSEMEIETTYAFHKRPNGVRNYVKTSPNEKW
jgi:hypothetical protein